jgi:hypothetical protein
MGQTGPAHDIVGVVMMVHINGQPPANEVRLIGGDNRAAVGVGSGFLAICHRRNAPEVQVAKCGCTKVGLFYIIEGRVLLLR